MALERLLESLTRDADVAVAELLQAARAEAEAEICAADSDRRRRFEERITARRRALEAALEEDLVEAGREAGRAVLVIREELLARVLARARACLAARLGDLSTDRASAALADVAASYLADRHGTLRCHPTFRSVLEPVARSHGLRFEEDQSLGPGALLASEDGRLSVDATLEQHLLRRWPDEAIVIARRLERAE